MEVIRTNVLYLSAFQVEKEDGVTTRGIKILSRINTCVEFLFLRSVWGCGRVGQIRGTS